MIRFLLPIRIVMTGPDTLATSSLMDSATVIQTFLVDDRDTTAGLFPSWPQSQEAC
jgi:hypothetical protein